MIHNSIVFEQTQEDSLTDPLTGLPNTRFMFMHLTRELARAERLKAEVALLVMDLDNFKEINDNHGHHVGDRALREVATVLRAGIRPYDICVRYAGDEFIVVLSGCGAEEAERKRVELQRTVDERAVRGAAGPPIAAWRSASARRSFRRTATSYEALLATADSRMYRDKTRRKQRAQVQPAATGTDGLRGGLGATAPPQEITDVDIERAGFGVSVGLSDLRLRLSDRVTSESGARSHPTSPTARVTPLTSRGRAAHMKQPSSRAQRLAQERFVDPASAPRPLGCPAGDGKYDLIRPAAAIAASSGRKANSSTERALNITASRCCSRPRQALHQHRTKRRDAGPSGNEEQRHGIDPAGRPNEPNGPSSRASVPGSASSRCGSGDAAVVDLDEQLHACRTFVTSHGAEAIE